MDILDDQFYTAPQEEQEIDQTVGRSGDGELDDTSATNQNEDEDVSSAESNANFEAEVEAQLVQYISWQKSISSPGTDASPFESEDFLSRARSRVVGVVGLGGTGEWQDY